jgi:AcrR family transcriptional regulator
MRLTQRTALPLFEARGFEAVTVNEIATEVGMAASTLYRHFATKEAIVLWDEFDDGLDAAFERELRAHPPLEAIRRVFVAEVGTRYDEDLEFQLRRIQYIFRTPAVAAAAVEAEYADTIELAEGLASVLSKRDRGAAPILAGAAMLALDAALDRWQADDAAHPLGQRIDEAFDYLTRLNDLR